MKSLKIYSLLVVVAASAASFGTNLNVVNHSFEDSTLGSGSFFYSPTPVPGWTATATGAPDRGVWNTTAAGKDGINIAFAYKDNALAQQLADSVVANATYTVDYLLGRTGSNTTGTVELWAGGTVANGIVTGGTLLQSQSTVFDTSTMNAFSFQYVAPNAGAVIGQLLTIRLAGTTVNGQSYVSFDNIRVATDAVPEPATLTILAGAALAAIARKKQKR